MRPEEVNDLPLTMDAVPFGTTVMGLTEDQSWRALANGSFVTVEIGPRRRKVNVRATLRKHGLLPE